MKTLNVAPSIPLALAVLTASSLPCLGADVPPPVFIPPPPMAIPGQAAHPATPPVNYLVRVDWKSDKAGNNVIQILTTEGTFKVNTSQPGAVKVGDSELPISVNLDGQLRALNPQQGELQLFLGRSVPVVSRNSGPPGTTSIQQRQEGLTVTVAVTFGKPVLVQKDGNGEISVLVEREKP